MGPWPGGQPTEQRVMGRRGQEEEKKACNFPSMYIHTTC